MSQNTMKLVILIYSMAGGGAERVISYFLPFLKKRDVEVHLVLMNPTTHYDIPKDIPIHYLEKSHSNENGLYKLVKLPRLAFKYLRLLKRIGATHSFSLLARPNYINLMAKKLTNRKYKVIISERNYPSSQYGMRDLKSAINKYLITKLYHKADLIIPNSRENGLDLINNFGCDKDRVRVINNPIDIQKIRKIAPIVDFFDVGFFNIITVGRLQEVKNHELLIEAVTKCENVRLYILGQGHLKTKLEKIIDQENLGDRVFLLGFDNNPYKYLKSADLFALSSNHEGFPNVLLEAMACGLPMVSTNCKSGPSELMELQEEKNDLMFTDYGILVPINNPALMAKAVSYMSTHPKFLEICKQNSAERVQNYEPESILSDYMSVLINC